MLIHTYREGVLIGALATGVLTILLFTVHHAWQEEKRRHGWEERGSFWLWLRLWCWWRWQSRRERKR